MPQSNSHDDKFDWGLFYNLPTVAEQHAMAKAYMMEQPVDVWAALIQSYRFKQWVTRPEVKTYLLDVVARS